MSLNIDTRVTNGVAIVTCVGRIVHGEESSTLRQEVQSLINSGHNQIILDLSDVTYVDSTGVGILVSSFTTARRGGGDVKLVGLTKRVRELLQIVKLLTIFEVFESVDAALQDVAKPRLEVVKRAAGEN